MRFLSSPSMSKADRRLELSVLSPDHMEPVESAVSQCDCWCEETQYTVYNEDESKRPLVPVGHFSLLVLH